MSTLAVNPQAHYTLTALSGPEKGSVFKLIADQVTIGRGQQNDISVPNDVRMSRHHAVITIGASVEITDVSGHKTMLINGVETEKGEIIAGSKVQLGDSLFLFSIQTAQPDKSMVTATSLNFENSSSPSLTPTNPQTRPSSRKKKDKTVFYIVVSLVVILFIWLFSAKVKQKTAIAIRTEETAQVEIDANRKTIEKAQSERQRTGQDTKQFEEAQPNFIKGFRDYRKGQYDRAVESFQACLSLFPNHLQCQRYLRLSQKKFSELVQYHMILASKYRTQNQFAACKSAYRNVMVMLKNPSDKTYLEAKTGFEVCDALEGDRY